MSTVTPTTTDRERYNRSGFLIHHDSVLPENAVIAAREGIDAIREGRYDRGQPEGSPWNPGDDPNTL